MSEDSSRESSNNPSRENEGTYKNWQMNDGTTHPHHSQQSSVPIIRETIARHSSHQRRRTWLYTTFYQYQPQMQKRMLYFGELTIDGLIDTGALSSAIPEMDLRKNLLLSPQSVIREGLSPNFQIIVANGQLETPKSTIV